MISPTTSRRALEEMMRYDPSVCTWRRLTVKASAINGVEIPAGSNLLADAQFGPIAMPPSSLSLTTLSSTAVI